MYTPVKVSVFTDQHDKLKKAVARNKPTSILIDLTNVGDNTLLLTRAQIARMERAKLIGRRKVCIRFSKRQVEANVRHRGGFLGMLAGLAAKALPSLLGGLTTGLVSGAVKHVVSGNGLYLHKSGHCVKIEPVKGKGLYLSPHRRLSNVRGDGLFIKRGSTIREGSGLILGPNSPFKNIPILNLLL